MTDQVSDLVAENRRDAHRDDHHPERGMQRSGEGEYPGEEEQGVTGQEEPDQQSGLGEDDETDDGQSPDPSAADQRLRVEDPGAQESSACHEASSFR